MPGKVQRLLLSLFLLLLSAAAWVACVNRPRTDVHASEKSDLARETQARLDPAAWGADHVGQDLPEFVDSGECLFCHRNDVGPSWSTNKHSQTIRDATPQHPAMQALADDSRTKALVPEVQFLMGDTRAIRFLRSAEAFGHMDLLSVMAIPRLGGRYRIGQAGSAHWDSDRFAQRCAGCHTTAVDPATHAFTTASLDCYVCHGDGPLEHANDTTLMPLAKARHDSPAVVTSICASCHIRFGHSRSSGLPYPNNFVAGDNLFKDFELDWSLVDNSQLNPADRHVLDNIREVVLHGNEQITCLSCHEVHSGRSLRHRDLPDQTYCQHCHEPGKPKREHKRYEVHSELCEY